MSSPVTRKDRSRSHSQPPARRDAKSQFARQGKGGDKEGLHNAKPVDVTGKRDATFGTSAMKPRRDT